MHLRRGGCSERESLGSGVSDGKALPLLSSTTFYGHQLDVVEDYWRLADRSQKLRQFDGVSSRLDVWLCPSGVILDWFWRGLGPNSLSVPLFAILALMVPMEHRPAFVVR
jgi:hypothetical protein